MKVFIIENDINALLCALFYSFEKSVIPDAVFYYGENRQQGFADEIFEIKTDCKKAERINDALVNYGGYGIISSLKTCLCSSEENAALYAFRFAYKTLFLKKDIKGNLADKTVADFTFTVKKVWTEAHRIKGFLRFSESHGGVIYARFSPDNDVIALIAPHFVKRLSGLPFVIHDVKRGKIAVSDGYELILDRTKLTATFVPSEKETKFEELFRTYYREINIESRKNLRQQDGYMPRRYRHFMPETYE